MTKPQVSAEPSMEDILASIRKMISEERMGPRPIPDQMSRTSYGESSPVARSAAPAASEARPETRTDARSERPESRGEPRTDPRPEVLPQSAPNAADRLSPGADRFGRAHGEAVRPTAERTQPERSAPERTVQERGPVDRGAADRSGPSFSSLSDALKAAKSPAEQRRSLEEKIADMLETGPGAPAPGASPADPLAVFSGNRTMPAGASAAPVRPAGAFEPDAKSAPARAPAATNGAAAPANVKPGDPAAAPSRDDAQVKPASPAASASASKPATAGPAAAPAADKPAERIIAMPSRLPAASGPGQAGVAPGTPSLNGAAAAAPAAAPFGVKQTPRPETPVADKTADKTVAPPRDASPLSAERKAPDTPQAPAHTQSPATGLTPRPIPGEQVQGPASAAAQPHMRAPATPERSAPAGAGQSAVNAGAKPAARETTAAPPVSEAAKVESALADLLAQSQESAGKAAPSEALLDELVDLVHNEPSSLSVFTSGNAFIHGVGSSHQTPAEPAAEADRPGTALQTMNGAAAPKLDRNAAELLRPMLRQWLADNMPRIVEEALRSELMSGQGGSKDSDKR